MQRDLCELCGDVFPLTELVAAPAQGFDVLCGACAACNLPPPPAALPLEACSALHDDPLALAHALYDDPLALAHALYDDPLALAHALHAQQEAYTRWSAAWCRLAAGLAMPAPWSATEQLLAALQQPQDLAQQYAAWPCLPLAPG